MEEALSVIMEKRGFRAIIALKGLPATCKTEVALRIGRWAKCPVISIQDFLGGGGKADYFQGAEADFSPPTTTDQRDRHHRKAFTSLLNVAYTNLYWVCNCVVIKSGLNTPYEFQQLLLLARSFFKCRLIILECKIRNKFLWKRRFESISDRFEESRSWSRPSSWKDIEIALDDDCAAHQFHHLPPSDDDYIYVTWMGVDPFYDLSLTDSYSKNLQPLSDEFNDAIKYLLTVPQQQLSQNPYVVEYDEFRRFLFDLKLMAAARKGRSESFCKGDCVFRYCHAPQEDHESGSSCGACQCEILRQPAYTCHFCVTVLDKTCAERFPTMVLESTIYDFISYLIDEKPEQRPCKTCRVGGKSFSEECRSCIVQHRLKFHLFPTILNHTCHPHFLSIQLVNQRCLCKACGVGSSYTTPGYGCKRCAFYCHMKCAFLPLELKQVHGGHDHVLKLMYTRDAMEVEEDPIWCDYCYEDMDPELWFYACQQCPHYAVHLHCSGGFDLPLKDPKMVKFVEQLQSQLDNC